MLWFEKFNFFIFNNFLLIGGKNSQQNEILVKKHLNEKDLYFHCEIQGGSSIIMQKLNSGDSDVNYDEIINNGIINKLAYIPLCLSKCWDLGVLKNVFYVYGDQVSKNCPTGQFLNKGSFIIRGKKNFLYPQNLEYAICLIFKINKKEKFLFETKLEKKEEISFGFPMCGPWAILKNYKYSLRILPGTEKKQKFIESVIQIFNKKSEGQYEEVFVKNISNQEYINVLLPKVRLGKIIK